MRKTAEHTRLFLCCHGRCNRVSGLTTLLSNLFALVEVDFYVMRLGTKVIETFRSLDDESSWEIVPEVVKAHTFQILLCELLLAHKDQFPSPCNEVRNTLTLLMLCLNNSGTSTFLGMFYSLPTDGRNFWKLYHVKATPSSNYTKSYNSSVPFVADRPIMNGPNRDTKWAMRWCGSLSQWRLHLEVRRKWYQFNPDNIGLSDSKGHWPLSPVDAPPG